MRVASLQTPYRALSRARSAARAAVVALVFGVELVRAASLAQSPDPKGMKLVGPIHDQQRAARQRVEADRVRPTGRLAADYARMKQRIEDETGLTFSMEASVVSQMGLPGRPVNAIQAMFTPNLNWKPLSGTALGTGSFQFDYLAAQYWSTANAAELAADLALNSPLNAYPANSRFFRQVSYTHEFPGDWLAVTLGQYPFASFDGNAYANDQQIGFISNSMSQNGSQNYSKASLGAYAQIAPGREVTFAAGFHDANNRTGSSIAFDTAGQGAYSWFLYGALSPVVAGLGRGQYALFYYNLPSVAAQPRASDGLSFSASQPVGQDWGLFVRANTAWNSSFAVQSSIAVGGVLNHPLGRASAYQVGLGLTWNRTNTSLYPNGFARPSETMLEVYWNWSFDNHLLVTPGVQVFVQPALDPDAAMAAVFSLRVTKLF